MLRNYAVGIFMSSKVSRLPSPPPEDFSLGRQAQQDYPICSRCQQVVREIFITYQSLEDRKSYCERCFNYKQRIKEEAAKSQHSGLTPLLNAIKVVK